MIVIGVDRGAIIDHDLLRVARLSMPDGPEGGREPRGEQIVAAIIQIRQGRVSLPLAVDGYPQRLRCFVATGLVNRILVRIPVFVEVEARATTLQPC